MVSWKPSPSQNKTQQQQQQQQQQQLSREGCRVHSLFSEYTINKVYPFLLIEISRDIFSHSLGQAWPQPNNKVELPNGGNLLLSGVTLTVFQKSDEKASEGAGSWRVGFGG
jgi:hypothetical protein